MTNSNKIARALRDPSVFTLCNNAPMFQIEPELVRKKLNVATFRLSQVGGHTPKARGLIGGSKKKRVQSKAIESDWRLDPIEEEERINLFGHLPRSSCRDYEKSSNEFPISLKRRYLNLRNQSIFKKMLLKGQVGNAVMAVGRSSTVVKELETIYCMGNFYREGRSRLNNVSDDVGVKKINVDFDCDCTSREEGRSNSQGTENLESKSISPDNTLDGIFGPIIQVNWDVGVDPSQLASLFDAEHHRNCAVIAPHGTFHASSDEDMESASSSTLSEMSINNNDDLCAFFDNNNTIDSGVPQKSQISEMKTPRSDHSSDGDVGADDRDVGTSYQIYEDNNDDPASSDKCAVLSTCLEMAFVTDREIHASSHSYENASTERNELVCEKENINTQSPLSPAQEHNQSLAKRRWQRPYEEIADKENFKMQNMLDGYEYEHIKAPHADHRDINIHSQNQVKSPVVTTFRLPTPPPSSDEGDDDCSDEVSELQNNQSLALSLAEETIDLLVESTVPEEEAGSSKGVTFFQLPTQYSSSEGEEEDDDDSEESNEPPPARVFLTTNNFLLPADEADKAVTTASGENIAAGLKGQPPLDQCFTNATESKHPEAEDLTDTPQKARFPVDNTSDQNPPMSLNNLTDTPLHPRKTFCQQRISLGSLTDTPLHPRQTFGQQRKSLDSLTDTPLERPKNAGQRKRLRAAPIKNNTTKPEGMSADKVPEKDRIRKRIEDKYRCRFLDAEAANDDSEDSDEEEAIKQIEDDEMSQ